MKLSIRLIHRYWALSIVIVVYLPICGKFLRPRIHASMHPSTHPPIHPSVYPPVHSSMNLLMRYSSKCRLEGNSILCLKKVALVLAEMKIRENKMEI